MHFSVCNPDLGLIRQAAVASMERKESSSIGELWRTATTKWQSGENISFASYNVFDSSGAREVSRYC